MRSGPALVPSLSILALAAAGAAQAACCAPPTAPLADETAAPALTANPATHARLGAFILEMEKTRLADVVQAAGAGEPAHRGDAAESMWWLCYTLPSARLWVMSNAEMGGPQRAITAVRLARDAAAAPARACPALPKAMQPVQLAPGVGLGSSASQLAAAFGSKAPDASGRIGYAFEAPAAKAGCTVSAWAGARLEAGKVSDLGVGQITSC